MDDKNAKQEDGQDRNRIERLSLLIKDYAITEQALKAVIKEAINKI